MISRDLYLNIVYRTLIMLFLALTVGYIISVNGSILFAAVCILLEVPLILNLIHYLNETNRKISYFLESIQNNDSSLLFPSNIKNKSIKEVYQSLRKINEQIQKLKIENTQREQYFQVLLEHVPTGIMTFNSKGFVYHANSSAKKLLSLEVLTHLHQLERVNRTLFRTITKINSYEHKLVVVTREKETVELSLKSSVFKINNEDLIILTIQDIRNELDENELNSWMKLIRVLTHEIMNTITPVTSLSKSLCRYLTVDGRTAFHEEIDNNVIQTVLEGLNVINQQGSSLMSFVESYRKLTRIPHPDKKIFKVEDLVNRIKVLYSSLENNQHVKLLTSIDPPEMELFADENLISLVLINLLKNALESIDKNPDGRIHLSAKNKKLETGGGRPETEDRIPDMGSRKTGFPFSGFLSPVSDSPDSRRINDGIEISLIDNGHGIPNDIIDHIFIPFFTTRENGSGIGLSLSRQIMRLHNGSLRVRSTPEKETVFSMVF